MSAYEIFEGRHEWRETVCVVSEHDVALEVCTRLNAMIRGFWDGEMRFREVSNMGEGDGRDANEIVGEFARENPDRIKYPECADLPLYALAEYEPSLKG